MLNKTVKYTLIILAFSSLGLLNACILVDDRPYGYAHGYYYYNYYPSLGIYYDTRRHLYFYQHHRHGWTRSRHLPKGYVLKGRTSHRMKMRHARPHLRHKEHRQRYDGGDHRSRGHRDGRSRDRGHRRDNGRRRNGRGGGLFK